MRHLRGGDFITPNISYVEETEELVIKPVVIEKEEIKFYIASNIVRPVYNEYTAVKNMTWGDWVNSEYNTSGFYTDSAQYPAIFYNVNGLGFNVCENGTVVLITDIIIENKQYNLT